jgi:two-component system phosphate regulon sensor histidine kinase PhoR
MSRTGNGWVGKYSESEKEARFLGVRVQRDGAVLGVLRVSKNAEDSEISTTDVDLLRDTANEMAIMIHEKTLVSDAEERATAFRNALMESGHEFRAPLHAILSQLNVLRSRIPEAEGTREIYAKIASEAFRAKKVLESSLTAGAEIEYLFREDKIGWMIDEIADAYRQQASARNIAIIVWDDAKKLPRINCDPDRIRQVITNLLDNAVKWSFDGEKIEIHGNCDGNWAVFSVQDKGTGIPEAYRDEIFRRLFLHKIIEDQKRQITGSGIGLKIVRRIVDAHKGKIAVTSTPFLNDPARQGPQDGHTVTFTVSLPTKGLPKGRWIQGETRHDR